MLHASHLVLRRGDRPILCGVSLSLIGGEIVGLMGASGSGKSAILEALSGSIGLTSGAVWLGGRALGAWAPRALARRRASLPQGIDLAQPQAAADIVLAGRAAHGPGGTSAHDRAIAAAALAWVGLDGRGHVPMRALAHGERRLVQLARVLAQVWGNACGAGAYVLLDDPLGGLDAAQQQRVMGIVRELARNGAAVLLALHELALATAHCDRLLYLRGGRLLAEGAPAELLAPALLRRVFGTEPEPPLAGAGVRELCQTLVRRPPENDTRPPPPPPSAA